MYNGEVLNNCTPFGDEIMCKFYAHIFRPALKQSSTTTKLTKACSNIFVWIHNSFLRCCQQGLNGRELHIHTGS